MFSTSAPRRFVDRVGAEVFLDGRPATVEDVFTLWRKNADGDGRDRWNAVLLRVGPDTFLAERHPGRYRVYERSKTNQAFTGRPSEKLLKLKSSVHGRLRPSDHQRGSTEDGQVALLLNNNVYVKPERVGCYGPDLTWFMRIDTPARDLAQFDTSRESAVTRPLDMALLVGFVTWALAHFFHKPMGFLWGFVILGILGGVFGGMKSRLRDSSRVATTALGGWLCLCAVPAIPLHFGWIGLEPAVVAEWWAFAMLVFALALFVVNKSLFSVVHDSLRTISFAGSFLWLLAFMFGSCVYDGVKTGEWGGESNGCGKSTIPTPDPLVDHPYAALGIVGGAWLWLLARHLAGPLGRLASAPTSHQDFRAQVNRLADRLEAGYSADVRSEVVDAFATLALALGGSRDERVTALMAYHDEFAYLAWRLNDHKQDKSIVKVGRPVTDRALEKVSQDDWRQLGKDLRGMAPGGKSLRISPALCAVLSDPDPAIHP